MLALLLLMASIPVVLVALGLVFGARPVTSARMARRGFLGALGTSALAFVAAEIALLVLATGQALAQQAVSAAAAEMSTGFGLAMIGVAIPTCMATVGAGIAVGPVGAASLAAITEKPELFGRSLVYLGLAEGIAIYGLVVTILLLGRLG